MSCELIRVNFKKGAVLSRETLTKSGRPAYSPYKDEHFKMMASQMAELAVMAHEEGADPRKMVVLILDENAEFEASMYDELVLADSEVIAGLKRTVAKITSQSPDPHPGESA